MELDSLVQIFGGAGATFYVMWLWLKDIKAEKKDITAKLEIEKEDRIKELREMLPLLADASQGLQMVIKTNSEKNTEVVETLKAHIDEKVKEITEKCNKK